MCKNYINFILATVWCVLLSIGTRENGIWEMLSGKMDSRTCPPGTLSILVNAIRVSRFGKVWSSGGYPVTSIV